jgi:hypothetical protein
MDRAALCIAGLMLFGGQLLLCQEQERQPNHV